MFARLAAAELLAGELRISLILNPQVLRGAALFLRGEFRDAIVYLPLREGLPPGRTGGVRSLGFSILAVALARQGDHAEGLAGLSEALQSVNASGEGKWNVELHRSRGLVLQSQNKLSESEVAFRQALHLARQQQAKSWELRAATSLARLWGSSADAPRHGSSSPPSMAGSPKVSTQPILGKRRHSSPNWHEAWVCGDGDRSLAIRRRPPAIFPPYRIELSQMQMPDKVVLRSVESKRSTA